MICMIAHSMAVLHHALHDVRSGLQKMTHHKKGSRRIVLFQCIQNRFRIAVFISAVKSQINYLFISLGTKIRIVLLEFCCGRISCGFLSFLPEAQPPVFAFLYRCGCLLQFAHDFTRRPAQKKHCPQKQKSRHHLFPWNALLPFDAAHVRNFAKDVFHINCFHFPLPFPAMSGFPAWPEFSFSLSIYEGRAFSNYQSIMFRQHRLCLQTALCRSCRTYLCFLSLRI